MMDSQLFIFYLFNALLNFGCYKSADVPRDFAEADILDGGVRFKTKLASCSMNAGDLKGLLLTGHKGEKGDPGGIGNPGVEGTKGPQGPEGRPGLQGERGERGEKGEKGQQGLQGIPGEEGEPGVPGENGKLGPKGERGSIGPSGAPGLDGTCIDVCPQRFREPKDDGHGEGADRGPGTKSVPVDGLCNDKRMEDEKFKETIWVNPDDWFQVKCNKTSKMTCIETNPVKTYNGEGALYVKGTEPFWVSEKNYNIAGFYGNISLHRIAWLQEHANQVSQVIRYHCKNSYIDDQPETALMLYGWNDLTIGPYSNPNSPLTYTVEHNDCTPAAPKDEWRFADIKITSKIAKRLPVVDFRINDIRKSETQGFFLELVELCFG